MNDSDSEGKCLSEQFGVGGPPEVNEDSEMQAQAGMEGTEMEQPDMDAAFYDDYPDGDDVDSGPEQEE